MVKKWIKRLDALTPYGGERNLDNRIFNEILLAGLDYSEDKRADLQENIQLLGELIEIHREFQADDDEVYPKDIFRDIFSEYMIEHSLMNNRLGQNFTPYQIVKFMVSAVVDEKDLSGEPKRWLDPAAGTGRFMLGVASYYAEKVKSFNFIMTNIDIDRRMFTYCTMNAILHGIPSINIHGNSLTAEVWDAFTTVALFPGVRLAQWFRLDPELAKSMTFPPEKPRGQQSLAELKEKYKHPVAAVEVEFEELDEKPKKKAKQTTLF